MQARYQHNNNISLGTLSTSMQPGVWYGVKEGAINEIDFGKRCEGNSANRKR